MTLRADGSSGMATMDLGDCLVESCQFEAGRSDLEGSWDRLRLASSGKLAQIKYS